MEESNLIVIAEQQPGTVVFSNFEVVREYLKSGLETYEKKVYTADNLSEAKADIKTLRAIKNKIKDKQTELEKAYDAPLDEVREKLSELISMLDEPIKKIDGFVKEVEKEQKRLEIQEYAEQKAAELGAYGDRILTSKAFWNEKWLNSAYTAKKWHGDIDSIFKDAADAITSIQATGGSNKKAMLAHYFSGLSMSEMKDFLANQELEVADEEFDLEDEDITVGSVVLRVTGTDRRLLQLMTQLDLSDLDYEILEDERPQSMKERTTADFDSFVAFDIEHTGTYGISKGDKEAEIIEIGAVRVRDGKVVDKFDMLANPGRKIVPMVARLTHITDDMVKDQPSVDEVIQAFKEFVGEDVLVGHNIKSCDIPHITRAAKRAGVSFGNEYLDTKVMAKKYQQKMHWENIKLPYLSEYFRIEQKEAHRAWCDAEANAYVFMEQKRLK